MKPIPFFQADAFTTAPFRGNPAAVCLLGTPLPDAMLQAIAAENNLSETAFLLPQDKGYQLRWFTPAMEVKLCGHATLASAHVLWEEGLAPATDPLEFYTLSGTLLANRMATGAITLDFPLRPGEPVPVPERLQRAIAVPIVHATYHEDRYVLELENAQTVISLRPDLHVLRSTSGVIVTARGEAGSPYDFVSRFFAGYAGIDEDPVTGSAHCCLAAYWTPRLGKTDFLAYQASARGGEMRVQVMGERVLLTGHAVTVIRGTLLRY